LWVCGHHETQILERLGADPMNAEQIIDALEGSARALLHDSSRAHAADSLQGFERSRARAIQLDRKAK
jgi:hypothetical protein